MATNPLSQLLIALPKGSPLLDPPTRAVLLMSLLAFVILGIGLMVGAMLGGRWARRWGGDDLRKPLALRQASTPPVAPEPAMLRGLSTDVGTKTDTLGLPTDDTRVG